MDPSLWSHANPAKSAVRVEQKETERAMLAFLRASASNQGRSRQQVMAFIDDLRRRMNEEDDEKRISPNQARNLLKPIKLALELNEVSLPWRKMMRMIPPDRRSNPTS